jgi:peptide/nickel transport system substrate-binding protein
VQYAPLSPVPARDTQRLTKLPTCASRQRATNGFRRGCFSTSTSIAPFLKDVRVREALYRPIDRDAYNRVVWHGFGKPAVSPVASTLTTFFDPSVPQYPQEAASTESFRRQISNSFARRRISAGDAKC